MAEEQENKKSNNGRKQMLVVGGLVIVAAAIAVVVILTQKNSPKLGATGYIDEGGVTPPSFEIWASDQSNSVAGEQALGVKGSFLWIFDSEEVQAQLDGVVDNATPLSCTPEKDSVGPCDAFDVFPLDLAEASPEGPTGNTLGDLPGFGRLHAMVADPQNKYVNANFFTPGGAFLGIIDVETKEAVSLFRLTKFGTSKERSVHMSFWLKDGSAIICSNLHGKAIERINIERDSTGKIIAAEFDRSATLGMGSSNSVVEGATFFEGSNAFGRPLLGSIVGDYEDAELGDITPNGYCKEDGCEGEDNPAAFPPLGRTNNVPICTIPSSLSNNVYVTLGGGGLFVVDAAATPMTIVGEYDGESINGAGTVGTQVGSQMFLNAGISAGGAGFEQSALTVYSLDDEAFPDASSDGPTHNEMNYPPPAVVFKDSTNTNTIGNLEGTDEPNPTGQLPGETTRRDSHGITAPLTGKYVHQFDRISNNVEVFDTTTYEHKFTYDLTSEDGTSGRGNNESAAGPCLAKSVTDDPNLVSNNPSPDLLGNTPDGKFVVVGLRGPAPVSVPHSGQGSCPGIGIIAVNEDGSSGRLVDVIRTTNTVDTAPLPTITGGTQYTGAERSDIHMAIVVSRE